MLRKWLKRALLVGAVLATLFAVLGIVFAVHCHNVHARFKPSEPSTVGRSIPGYARSEEDTFLTYAEWYIVWSYQEKGAWQQTHLPSGFPYFGAITQYWSGYCCSYSVVRDKYPFNFGDHLMLVVIGTSFTVEYALKGLYENTVGRLFEWMDGHAMTDEDRLAARVARDYGAFVADRPFYEFPFFSAFRDLWLETKLWGPHVARKWERKLWLSVDYGIEGVYCGLMELASHATYGVEEDVTFAEIQNAPADLFSTISAIRKVQAEGPDSYIVKMPRYRKFTDASVLLFRTPARYLSIAGNRQVMVTAIVPRDWKFAFPAGELLFASDLLTDPRSERVALRFPVDQLQVIVTAIPIEHIYDF